MKGSQFFDGLIQTFERIIPSKKCYEFFSEIQKDLSDVEILDSFYQLKKDDKGSGLALEIILFDTQLVYDIVFTSNSLDLINVPIKGINSISINAIQEVNLLPENKASVTDKLSLTINTNDAQSLQLEYKSDTKKFSEFNRLRTNLSKLL
jgi:hypothetical protein